MSALDVLPLSSCCADGPALVRWLEARNVRFRCLCSAQQRAVQRWRRGRQARFDTVERLLLDLDLTVDELPEDLWHPYDKGRRGYRKPHHA